MYLADYHMHSRMSSDAKVPMRDMAEAAIAAGMDEICFTDHIEPFYWSDFSPRTSFDWEMLQKDFAEAEAACGDRIKLRLGMELGDACSDYDGTKALMADAPELDFIIGSVHRLSDKLDGQGLFVIDPKDEYEARRQLIDYLELVLSIVKNVEFSVLGHLTLPLRYMNEMRGLHMSFDGFEAEIEEILRILLQKGRGIELNTNGGKMPLPDAKWLKMYRQMGGEIITIGSDAHKVERVGCAIRERQELLRECGFKRFCTFTRMQPVWHEL